MVVLAMNGDDAAFGELVRRRQGALRNLLRRLSRDSVLADDLAQQAFVLAWKSIRTLKSPGAFAGWLRKLAINCWLQQVRASARKREVPLDEELMGEREAPSSASSSRTTESGMDESSRTDSGRVESSVTERLDLDAALARLPPDARLCVVLAYSEGMSHAQISESTELPLGTVKSHIARGAARLREILEAYGERRAR